MRRIALFMGAITGLLFFSCTKEEFSPISEDQEGAEGAVMEVTCSIPDYEFVDTKATIAQSGSFTWSTGDQMSMWPSVSAVYSGTPQAVIFKVKQGGSKTATLVGNGWGLLRGQKYYASFPYNSSNTYSKVSINYAGLNQVSNGSTSHLGARDYQHAVTTVPAQGNASVNFSRISSIVKFVITVPENRANVKYTKLTLSADEDIFSSAASYNPSADEVVLTSTKVNQISMTLNGTTGFTPTDGVLTLYVIMAPADWAGKNIKLSLRDEYSYSYSGSFTPSKNQSSGSAGTLPISVSLNTARVPDGFVDMGLSVMWGSANLGAERPEDNGNYIDIYGVNYGSVANLFKDKYGALSESIRTPSKEDFAELINNSTISTETLNGKEVKKFVSNINSAVIYLPKAGGYFDSSNLTSGYFYCTSSESTRYNAYYYNGSGFAIVSDTDDDDYEFPIRPILFFSQVETLTGLALDPTSLKIEEGGQATINAIVSPADAQNKKVNWTSSDTNIAIVDADGVVTGVSSGTATITAQTVSGGYTATCDVTVVEKQLPYLTMTSTGSSSISLLKTGSPSEISLEYRIDDGDWSNYSVGNRIDLADGQKVAFRAGVGGNSSFSSSDSNYYSFVNSGNGTVAASGKVMSLLDRSCTSTTLPGDYCFTNLFAGFTSLTSAPELDATVMTIDCYRSMFEGCTMLKTAPALPAKTLADYCYESMFKGCSSLVNPPELNADRMAKYCYLQMFMNCTSLVTAPDLPATTLADQCYIQIFSGCKALKNAPALNASYVPGFAYGYMFYGCSSLVDAPDLPAESINAYSYSHMFANCTSLVDAPVIKATQLDDSCYEYMFSGCRSLKNAPELPLTRLSSYCYSRMFSNCTQLEIAPVLPAPILMYACYDYMFEGCSSLRYLKALFTTTPSSTYTESWLSGVAENGVFVMGKNATWTVIGNHGIPEGWIAATDDEESGDYLYADLGLPSGRKWAICNVGASSPEEYGEYYAWGETETKSNYSWDTYKWGTMKALTKYVNNSFYGTVDNKTVLEKQDDAAYVKLGGNWRMPTLQEQNELLRNCTFTNTTFDGAECVKVTGPNGRSIVLPKAGYKREALFYDGSYAFYWNSTLYQSNSSMNSYFFDSGLSRGSGEEYRCYGIPVRPVYDDSVR